MATTAAKKKAKAERTPTSRIPSRIRAVVERKDATYMGTCIMQAPGAWSRMGPTWCVPGIGWVTYGPGVASWGTTAGLAQLAADHGECSPTWHATGWSIEPNPNIVFAVPDDEQLGEDVRGAIADVEADGLLGGS